jgi:hypothetical protein
LAGAPQLARSFLLSGPIPSPGRTSRLKLAPLSRMRCGRAGRPMRSRLRHPCPGERHPRRGASLGRGCRRRRSCKGLAATLLSKVGHVIGRCLDAAWLPVDPAGARTGQIRPACASATRDFATQLASAFTSLGFRGFRGCRHRASICCTCNGKQGCTDNNRQDRRCVF